MLLGLVYRWHRVFSRIAPGPRQLSSATIAATAPRYNRFKPLAREPVAGVAAIYFVFARAASTLAFLSAAQGSPVPPTNDPFMQKTKKSVAKRFKLTATGKLMRRTPGFRHLLANKSTKSKRRATRDKLVAPGHAAPLKRCLPFGL